jgi:hypothetical protein
MCCDEKLISQNSALARNFQRQKSIQKIPLKIFSDRNFSYKNNFGNPPYPSTHIL